MTAPARWEHFPHEADAGLRGVGADVASAFEQIALALTAVVTDPASVAARIRVEVDCEAPDLDVLLMDWLNALIREMAERKLLFGRFHVRVDGLRLHGEAFGERVDVRRHEPAAEPKGATFTGLSVLRGTGGEWIAECVVDV